MRRVIISLTITVTLLIICLQPVYAQTVPTPQPDLSQPQQDASSATTTPKDNALQTISTIKNFVTSADSMLGGFIFYTPDVFGNTITLKDGTTLPGLATYRNMFYAISIPLIALSIAYYALKRLSDDSPYALKNLVKRLVVVAVMFIVTPTLLSYSIQANNLLVNQITSNQTFTTFITDFLNNEQQQIIKGTDPQNFGIPDQQSNAITGVFGLTWQFLLQIALFLIALFFFLMGFLFIAFQFIIRFASLLFLSVLYPLAIPFALSEKTEGITNTYFKTWFMFLIHQPAFALGYMLAIGFLGAILKTNGASLGMLFFYSGFLFFLGGVSTLVTHVFGTSWSAISTNLQAAFISAPIGKAVNDFKRGVVTGNATSIGSLAGRQFGAKLRSVKRHFHPNDQGTNTSSSQDATGGAGAHSYQYVKRQGYGGFTAQTPVGTPSSVTSTKPEQTQKATINSHQEAGQTIQIKQQGYSITNKKTGVKTTYLSESDAKADGYKPQQLKKTTIEGNYLNMSSLPTNKTSIVKVREHLRDKEAMQMQNVAGIITKNPARKSNELITRIYTKEGK